MKDAGYLTLLRSYLNLGWILIGVYAAAALIMVSGRPSSPVACSVWPR